MLPSTTVFNPPADKAGLHAYAGSCDPALGCGNSRFQTFSVSCFQWVPRSGKGLKRGPCKVRVRGSADHPENIYRKAAQICKQLDSGTYSGPKTVVIRTQEND